MKQGLSLRVSQHLALTPQLQQSIRLLQLSTLELSQEVDQMLDENPFLELTEEHAEREDFGLPQADTPVSEGDRDTEFAAAAPMPDMGSATVTSSSTDEDNAPLNGDEGIDWDGDGSTEMAPDDGEWGVDAKARSNNLNGDEDKDATELARTQESLQAFLHRQALGLRLCAEDRAALRFLIESLNDDGYLEEPLEDLARTLNPPDEEQLDELVHHFTVALGLLHSLEPVGVGARNLGECLRLQIAALLQDPELDWDDREVLDVALRICAQSMELLARRDIKRLVLMGVGSDALVREAIAVIGRLEPKPGRRFVDVERNIVVPDVLVIPVANANKAASPKFRVMLNPDVMPRLKVHDIYANVLRNHRGGKDSASHAALQQRLQEARWFIKNIQQRF
ncbi:MAG: RNA polymerase factor sigma-54, partial [Rhodoferax sp.]|nr:RNA polymerase factor sigma-54 [Rhodoferax sp.]